MLPDSVQAFIDAEIAATTVDYSDLRAVYLNGTLKRSPEPSHTDGLRRHQRAHPDAASASASTSSGPSTT